MTTVAQAINAIRPGAQYTIHDGTYATLIWLDQVQTKPTEQEVIDQIAAMDAATSAEAMRLAGINADSNLAQLLTQARTSSVAQIDTWIANNVTTLAQARTVLAAIIKWIAMQEK